MSQAERKKTDREFEEIMAELEGEIGDDGLSEKEAKIDWDEVSRHTHRNVTRFSSVLSPTFKKGYVAHDFDDFINMDIPKRGHLLYPWLPERGLAMVFADRGVGKTFFALNVAYAVATGGSYLGWKAEKPRSVLYLDGEMVASDLQERLKAIHDSSGESLSKIPLKIMTPDTQKSGMPNLAIEREQIYIHDHVQSAALIIVDNIASLCRCGSENETEAWRPVQQWALSMRAHGHTVLFVHHAGKSGKQRGTSSREDVLDTVIQLSPPSDYDSTEGARFEVKFTKHRGFYGEDAAPLEVSLGTGDDGRQSWVIAEPAENTYERVISGYVDGKPQAEIARELGVNRSTVCRYVKQARSEGRLTEKAGEDSRPGDVEKKLAEEGLAA